MLNKKLAGLMAAGAFVALAGAVPAAHAQMMAPQPNHVDVYTNGPQADPGDSSNWSARQNVTASDRYEQMVHTSPGFRQARIQKECGSINEPSLHQQCVDSFNN
jgi:hypothetical protein